MRSNPLLQPTLPRRSIPRRRVLLRAATLAGTALLSAALLAWSPQPVSGWNQSSAESTLWQLLNGDRVNNGLKPLAQNGTLVSLARWRSKDMIDRDYFDHVVLGTGYQVYHWYDLNGLNYQWGGENIGWNNGYPDADSPVAINDGFMNSPGHRANILEPAYTHGGVGAYGADDVSFLGKIRSPRMYTELFMVAAAAATPPPAPPPPAPTSPPASPRPQPAESTPAPTTAEDTLHVDEPAPPTPAESASLVVEAAHGVSTAAVRALPGDGRGAAPALAPQLAAAPYRVEAAAAPNRGLFETVFGSLLGFFLG